MNLTRCKNGHFYDEDKFDKCPHCGSTGQNDGQTVALNRDVNDTMALTQGGEDALTSRLVNTPESPSLRDAVQKAASGAPIAGGDSVTVSYYNKAIGSEPVVGWVVCVEGSHIGEDFRLKSGRNFIGRTSGVMDVAITGDNTVSREKHAIIVYEPKNHTFMVQPGESKELCYLNDKVVLSAEEIKIHDIITVGETKLMFFPCCDDVFNWESVKRDDKKEDKK
jgi:hypothetical protein